MRRPSPQAPDRNGFTLIELLLGSIIAAVIGLTVFSVFWSAITLNNRLVGLHKNSMAMLTADQMLTRDLENAVALDLSISYPGKAVFEGKSDRLSFLTKTPQGIQHVSYFTGTRQQEGFSSAKRSTGFLSRQTAATTELELLLRREDSVPDWANETNAKGFTQIVAGSLKKDSFQCAYAAYSQEIKTEGAKAVTYSDHWDGPGLPMMVSCYFHLYDARSPNSQTIFQRDIFLPQAGPVNAPM